MYYKNINIQLHTERGNNMRVCYTIFNNEPNKKVIPLIPMCYRIDDSCGKFKEMYIQFFVTLTLILRTDKKYMFVPNLL